MANENPSANIHSDPQKRTKIAFFGLGNMGAGMAANLVKAGMRVCVYDLLESNVNAFLNQHPNNKDVMGAAQPDEAVKEADFVISMLPAGKHVKSLYFGDETSGTKGITASAPSSAVFIDCSTIEASEARDINQQMLLLGLAFADAPVSGGVAGAAAGTLTFITGGSEETVSRIRPVLETMGKNIFHAGDVGAGQVAKICNNMLLAILMAGTSEALQLAMDNGIDAKVMSDIMKASSGNNWALQVYNPCPGVMENVPSSNGYKGGFMVDLMNKDLGLAMATAAKHQSLVPMGSLAKSLYQLHSVNGNGGKDFSSIFESLKAKR
uniref:3-hydroxyisobutyrate dehydrogenase n=1 Tax=Ningiella ruwaisensis TaxID=2364274 RepID=UPI0010A0791A|nr:3-hydroxyisobutyrate dehydrogenase [Ningiella ruwaisensis]